MCINEYAGVALVERAFHGGMARCLYPMLLFVSLSGAGAGAGAGPGPGNGRAGKMRVWVRWCDAGFLPMSSGTRLHGTWPARPTDRGPEASRLECCAYCDRLLDRFSFSWRARAMARLCADYRCYVQFDAVQPGCAVFSIAFLFRLELQIRRSWGPDVSYCEPQGSEGPPERWGQDSRSVECTGRFLSYLEPEANSQHGAAGLSDTRVQQHTSRSGRVGVRIRVLPCLEQLLRLVEQCLGVLPSVSGTGTGQEKHRCGQPVEPTGGEEGCAYPLFPGVGNVPVGLEEGADVEGLATPEVPVNSPVERQLQRAAIERPTDERVRSAGGGGESRAAAAAGSSQGSLSGRHGGQSLSVSSGSA